MLNASIASILAKRDLDNATDSRPMYKPLDTRGIRVTRQSQDQTRMYVEGLKEQFKLRQHTAKRIVDCTVLRKDGKTVAKAGKKTELEFLRDILNRCNEKIGFFENKLKTTETVHMSRTKATANRDMLVYRIVSGQSSDIESDRAEAMRLNREFCRPEHGYPAPPFRRGDDYPAGGLWGAPEGGYGYREIDGEAKRLSVYMFVVLDKGELDKARRIQNHLERLDTMREHIASNPVVRKNGKHSYMLQ